jgi:hypothetical protein
MLVLSVLDRECVTYMCVCVKRAWLLCVIQ